MIFNKTIGSSERTSIGLVSAYLNDVEFLKSISSDYLATPFAVGGNMNYPTDGINVYRVSAGANGIFVGCGNLNTSLTYRIKVYGIK